MRPRAPLAAGLPPHWLAVALAALALQLVISAAALARGTPAYRTLDTDSYEAPARALLAKGRFDVAPDVPRAMTARTPGYPLLLAGVYRVAGESPAAVLMTHLLLRIALVLLVGAVASRVFRPAAGLIAAGLVAVDPVAAVAAAGIQPEALFALLFFAAVSVFVRGLGPNGDRWAFLAGVVMSLATLTRPLIYYLVPLLAAALVVRGRQRAAFAFLLVPAITLGGWQLRNQRETGLASISTIEQQNLYFYRAAGVVALREGRSLDEVQRRFGYGRANVASAAEIRSWGRTGISILLANPLLTARVQAEGALRMLFGPGTATARTVVGLSLAPLAIVQLLALTLGLVATAWLRRELRPARGWLPWVLAATYIVCITAGPEAYSRFRVPLTPILAILAAPGLARLFAIGSEATRGVHRQLGARRHITAPAAENRVVTLASELPPRRDTASRDAAASRSVNSAGGAKAGYTGTRGGAITPP